MFRNKFHNKSIRPSDFFFVQKNKKPFNYDNLNKWMHQVIILLNKKLKFKIDPSCHTPHTLRQGGCTDMVRHGVPAWRIEMTGRWTSTM